jgi:hypothetical protein
LTPVAATGQLVESAECVVLVIARCGFMAQTVLARCHGIARKRATITVRREEDLRMTLIQELLQSLDEAATIVSGFSEMSVYCGHDTGADWVWQIFLAQADQFAQHSNVHVELEEFRVQAKDKE